MPFAPGLFEFQQDQGPKIQTTVPVGGLQGPVNGQTLPVHRVKQGLALVFNAQTPLEGIGNQGLQSRHPVLTRFQALNEQVCIGLIGPLMVCGFTGLQGGADFDLVTPWMFLFELPKRTLIGLIGS